MRFSKQRPQKTAEWRHETSRAAFKTVDVSVDCISRRDKYHASSAVLCGPLRSSAFSAVRGALHPDLVRETDPLRPQDTISKSAGPPRFAQPGSKAVLIS